MNERTLVIGNRNYSSWSLRPYLLLRHVGLEVEVLRLPLDTPEYRARIGAYSPTGRVPVLIDGDLTVFDSLAICEYAVELSGRGWPADRAARAVARSVSAEIHAGFPALRAAMPMNLRACGRRIARTPELAADIRRIDASFAACRARFGGSGPWLFGDYSVADSMYAPVACRFGSYGEQGLGGVARAYVATVLADPELVAWRDAALAETEVLAVEEAGE
jgi:glutathione S-transferase